MSLIAPTSPAPKPFWSRPGLVFLAAVLLFALAVSLFVWTKPEYAAGRVSSSGQSQRSFTFPFVEEKTASQEHLLTFTMKLAPLHPTVFMAYARDLIGAIEINGRLVVDFTNPPALHDDARLDLGPWLKAGDNLVRIKILNLRRDSSFYWQPSLFDPLTLAVLALTLGSLALGLYGLILVCPPFLRPLEGALLFAALAVRLIYLCGTPYAIRSYDWEGHLQYAQYVATHLSLPPFDLGWETFQPPLFYTLYGLIGRSLYALGGSYDLALTAWQFTSFTLTGGILFLALWIGHLLFPGPANRWRLCFLGGIAALPGLVFFSTWISNDVLQALISFAFLGALLTFWRDHRWPPWIAASVLTGLGLLTKSNSLVFAPIVAMSLFFAANFSWGQKARYLAVFLVLVGLVSGWFQVKRSFESKDAASFLIAGLEDLGPEQKITPTPASLLTFNPVAQLREPFIWAGGNDRKDRYPEFLFKTALFGEWHHGEPYLPLARGILFAALVLLLYAGWGVFTALRSTTSPAWPLAVTILGAVSAQIVLILKAPYACHQNFRLSTLLVVPIFYFIIKGLENSPPRLQVVGLAALAVFAGASTLFLLTLHGVLG